MRHHPGSSVAQRRGFSAVELTAVASIIAILALILIPIVRNRLESVRRTAALDDMRSIEVAQVLANADTGLYFRLSDLDNPAVDLDTFNNAAATLTEKAGAVSVAPNASWNRPLDAITASATPTRLGTIGAKWNGPYITYNEGKFQRLSNFTSFPPVASTMHPAFRVFNPDTNVTVGRGPGTGGNYGGPILILRSNNTNLDGNRDDDYANSENHPVDPWGSPYIFFGPGKIGSLGGDTGLTSESNFGTSIVYCFGPDGAPGENEVPAVTGDSGSYYREAGVLGSGGDDLYRIF